MSETISIPRFRSAKRLVQWMERNWHSLIGSGSARLPEDRERVFLTTKRERPEEVAACIARYSAWAGRLPPEIESLIFPFKDHLVSYIRSLSSKGCEVGEDLLEHLAGDSKNLWRAAKSVGRLPERLEATLVSGEAKWAYFYAKEVLRGRLPEALEEVFFKDTLYASKYAFDVIRGFSSVRLPEALHAFMVMKSFEDPENEDIREYIEASDSDPSKVGNS